jgi:AcrR family transcriptional regulator
MEKLTRREREHLRREKEILDVAEQIFARDGYEQASMNEISEQSEFSKRTLYQYFESKSDLYLSVALRVYSALSDQMKRINQNKQSGYESIKQAFLIQFEFYKKNRTVYRIIYDIEKVKAESANPKLHKVIATLSQFAENLYGLIKTGQQDGSIIPDLDPRSTAASLILLLTGFFNQLSINSHSPLKGINIEDDQFIAATLKRLLLILNPKKTEE